MATWGLHIRIAEELLKIESSFDTEKFLVGNIGPDCGMPNEDWSRFDPPTEISHWLNPESGEIMADKFYNKYLDNGYKNSEEKSFLIGYYVHLLTDQLWRSDIDNKKKNNKSYAELNINKKFIWTIKKDWYDLDRLYFRNNPNSIFFKVFQNINEFPNYLEYYPKAAIIRQVKYITDFYLKEKNNLDRTYIYLNEIEMDIFVKETVLKIEKELKNKKLISFCPPVSS